MRNPRRTRPLTAMAGLLIAASLVGCQTPSGVLREQGVHAYNMKEYGVSRAKFQICVDRDPTDWKANYYLGLIALENQNANRARTYLEIAYTLRNEGPPRNPETFEIANALAEALYQQGDGPRLVGFCDELIARFGRVADYIRKADFLAKLGDHDAAIIAYRQAIRIAPDDDPAPFLAMADFYDSIDDREAATRLLRQAYYVDPEDYAIGQRLRAHDVIPGPTAGMEPVR